MPEFGMTFTANVAPLEQALLRMGQTARKVGAEISSIPPPTIPALPQFTQGADLAAINATTTRLEALQAGQIQAGILSGSLRSQGLSSSQIAGINPQIREAAGLGPNGLNATPAELAATQSIRSGASRTYGRIAAENPSMTAEQVAAETAKLRATQSSATAETLYAEKIAKSNIAMEGNIAVLEAKITPETESGVLARQEAALRGQLAAIKKIEFDEALKMATLQAQAYQAQLAGLTIYEYEAEIAAADRQEAIKFGHAKQSAYLRDIILNDELANLAAEEVALREIRVSTEKANAAEVLLKPISQLPITGNPLLQQPIQGAKLMPFQTGAEALGSQQATVSVTDSLIAAKKKEILAESDLYLQSQIRATFAQNQSTALIEAGSREALAADTIYLEAKVRSAAATDVETAALLVLTPLEDIERKGHIAAMQAQNSDIARMTELEYLAQKYSIQLKVDRLRAEQEYKVVLKEAMAADLAYIDARVANSTLEKESAALIEARIQAELAVDSIYLEAKASIASSAIIEKESLISLMTLEDLERTAHINVMSQRNKQIIKELEINQLNNDADLQASAQLTLAKEQYQIALRAKTAEVFGQAGVNLPASVAGQQPFGSSGFFAGGLSSTIKYAAPAALAFGAIAGLASSIKESQSLEKVLKEIDQQMVSIGKGAEFGKLKNSILEVAASSGTASPEVAKVALQLQGAFGGDTQKTISETAAAIEAVKVTGLSLTETIDAFTAITQSFKNTGITITDVTDKALGLQERFGVLAKQTISFASDLAPVAADIGFTVNQLEALGAVSQKYSGRSGTTLADAYGRVLPKLSADAGKIIALFGSVNQTVSTKLSEQFGTGDTAGALKTLIGSYDGLGEAQKKYFIELIGGRREAQAIIPIFEHSTEVLKEWDRTQSDSGKTTQYYTALQQTLGQQLSVLGENLKIMGMKLYDSGLSDFFKYLVGGVKEAAGVLGILFDVFKKFNDITQGIAGNIAGMAGAMYILTKTSTLVLGIFTKLLSMTRANTAATVENTVATSANATAKDLSMMGQMGQGVLNATSAGGSVGRAFIPGGGGNPLAASAGGIGGFARALPTGLAVGVAGFAIVDFIKTYMDQKNIVELAGKDLYEKALLIPAGELDQFIQSGKANIDWKTSLGTWLTGNKTPQAVLEDAKQKQAQPAITDALQVLRNNMNQLNEAQLTLALQDVQAAGVAIDSSKLNSNGIGASTVDQKKAALDAAIANLQRAIEADPTNNALQQQFKNLQDALGNIGPISTMFNLAYDTRMKIIDSGLLKAEEARNAEKAALEQARTAAPDVDSAKASFEAGDISLSAYLKTYDTFITALKAAVDAGHDPVLTAQLAKASKERNKAFATGLISLNDMKTQLSGMTGGGSTQSQIDTQLSMLNDPQFTDPASRQKIAMNIVSLQEGLLKSEIDAASGTQRAIDLIKNGLQLPEEARAALINAQLDPEINVPFGAFLDLMVKIFGQDAASFQQEVLIAIEGGKEGRKVLIDSLQNKADALALGLSIMGGNPDDLIKLRAYIASLKGTEPIAGVIDPNAVKVTADDQKKLLEDQSKKVAELQKAKMDYLKALNSDDPVAVAQLTLQSAQQEVATLTVGTKEWWSAKATEEAALKGVRDAGLALQEAKFSYVDAVAMGDAYALALNAQAKSQAAIDNAHNEADRTKALAQKLASDQQFIDAINAIYNSKEDIIIAQANAAGDTVTAAQENVNKAQAALDAVVLKYKNTPGKGEAEINAARANLVNSQRSLQSAQLQSQLDDYQFMLDMGQISKQQFLAYLQALRNSVNINEKDRRALDRQIKALQGELGQDLQFNLPTSLGLPVLYDARRLNQSVNGAGASAQGVGIGVQDNRQITVNVAVANGMTPAQAQTIIVDALGITNRTSPTGRTI